MQQRVFQGILLFLLCISAMTSVDAQSKKQLKASLDTLQKQNAELKLINDSLKLALNHRDSQIFKLMPIPVDSTDTTAILIETPYMALYTYIKNEYEINDTAEISTEAFVKLVDSLETLEDSLLLSFEELAKYRLDSIEKIRAEVNKLAVENNAFRDILGLVLDDKHYPVIEADYAGKWNVFLQPVHLVGDSVATALVSKNNVVLPDSLYKGMIETIEFVEDELVNLKFIGGYTTKAFYKINNFSRDGTYTIDLDKGDEIDIRVFVTHVPRGIQISYDVPGNNTSGQFFFGYLKR